MVSKIIEATQEETLGWREGSVFGGSGIQRRLVAGEYALVKRTNGLIQLLWTDDEGASQELSSNDDTQLNELWSLASKEPLLTHSPDAAIERALPDTDFTPRYSYTRDYIKTCTVELKIAEKHSGCGVLVSAQGHVITSATILTRDEPVRIQLRGMLRSYGDVVSANNPLGTNWFEASIVGRGSELAILQIQGLNIVTPHIIPSYIESLVGEVWGGFRWWLLEGAIVEASIDTLPVEGLLIEDTKVSLITKRFPQEAIPGSPLLHKKTGSIIGLVKEGRDTNGRIPAIDARKMLDVLRQHGITGSYSSPVFAEAIEPHSPHCRTYVERAEYEQLREILLGDAALYIGLIAPPLMGVNTLFRRFEFENIRFRFYKSSVDRFADSKAQELLWYIIQEVKEQVSNSVALGPMDTTLRAIEAFEDFVYRELIKDTDLTIVFHIDHIESIISNNEILGAFLTALTRLFEKRSTKREHSRVRFAISGHIFTEDELSTLANQEEMFRHIEVGHFSKEETRELTNLLGATGLTLDEASHDSVYQWTGGHPLLVQHVCRKIEALGLKGQSIEANLSEYLVEDPDPIVRRLIVTLRERLSGDFEAKKVYMDFCDSVRASAPFKRGLDRYMNLYHLGIIKSDDIRKNLFPSGEFFLRNKDKILAI
jgi:hypothetical protein